jgi:hypothetical protein
MKTGIGHLIETAFKRNQYGNDSIIRYTAGKKPGDRQDVKIEVEYIKIALWLRIASSL